MEMEMESKVPGIAKSVWKMVRVVFFMLRKGISKGKLMLDLNLFLKRRRKLAGKAIANLMFHHHNHHTSSSSSSSSASSFTASREYEFSCSNTPNHFLPTIGKRNRHNNFFNFKCAHAPATRDDDVATVNAVKAVLEMLNHNEAMVEASPALPGFGRSPMVRQLRVTDSPFPVRDDEKDDDDEVDKAAEEFIKRFYKELRKQD